MGKCTGKILVLSNDTNESEALCTFLQAQGFHLGKVKAAAEVTQSIEAFGPELLLMNLPLPAQETLALLENVRRQYSMEHLPIILCVPRAETSAEACPETTVAALQSGANDLVSTPFHLRVTLARIETHLRLRRALVENLFVHQKLVNTSKMSALGEMAGGIAHEINNPLAIILGKSTQLRTVLQARDFNQELATKMVDSIANTALRIARIVKGLRMFSRDADKDPFDKTNLEDILVDTFELCAERFKNHAITLELGEETRALMGQSIYIECRAVQVIQVFLNLLNNAHDAVETSPEKWVRVDALEVDEGTQVEFHFTDSGPGIPQAIRDKLMQPFFTTKEIGKGTGLGLSISKGIIDSHGGILFLDETCQHTRFVVRLPKVQNRTKVTRKAA